MVVFFSISNNIVQKANRALKIEYNIGNRGELL